jgi:hypothetical protein
MLENLRKILRSSGGEPSASEIERGITQLDDRVSKASRDRDDLSSRRVDALLESDQSAARLRKQISDLGEELTDLAAARERLVERLDKARLSEADRARRQRYDDALARRDQTLKALRARLPKHIREHLALIRLAEESRAECEAANADAPEGAACIEDAEAMLRDLIRIPEKLLSEEREIIWVRTDLFPHERIDPKKVRDFRDLSGGRGQFVEATNRVRGQSYRVKTDQVVECLGSVQVKRTIRSLDFGMSGARLRAVAMPGVRWNEEGYVPPRWPSASPNDVLDAVTRAEVATVEPSRQPLTVMVVPSVEALP